MIDVTSNAAFVTKTPLQLNIRLIEQCQKGGHEN